MCLCARLSIALRAIDDRTIDYSVRTRNKRVIHINNFYELRLESQLNGRFCIVKFITHHVQIKYLKKKFTYIVIYRNNDIVVLFYDSCR